MISLDYRSGLPLYHQVKEGCKRLILSGAIGENERLPSVRELASMLAINPNTIQRAYRELEAEGYVGSSPGKGIYAMGTDSLREYRIKEIYDEIFAGIRKLLDFGQEKDAILGQIKSQLEKGSAEPAQSSDMIQER